MSTPITFKGPALLGPRVILILVELLGSQRTSRDIARALGYKLHDPRQAASVVSSIGGCLRKMEDRGFVTATHVVVKKKGARRKGRRIVYNANALAWCLTERGKREAQTLAPAVRALRKSKLGLAVIRGTATNA